MEERTIFQPSAAGSVRPGTRLNGVYEIEQLIAQGGMGEVYRGFNIQTHDLVAIKMILPEFTNNPEVFELFRREASILHNLMHEAIVRYFVISVDPDILRAYLAMEFVDGPSLTKRLSSGPLPLTEVRILQRRIAYALDAAHRLGVVHRDVSPDNIILPDGDVRKAKIIDFGIARSLRMGERTIIGSGFAGKYNYVSPEQLGMADGDVTFKSDIYSFGLVLAEAARGRPLDMDGSQLEVIEKRRAVPDLSDVDRSIRPLIQAMLQPLPEKRPPSMAAVAEWGEGPQAAAARRALSTAEPPERQSSGGHVATILGALIAIVSVGGVAYVFRDDLALWIGRPTAPTQHAVLQQGRPQPSPAATPQPAQQGPEKAGLPPLGPTTTQVPPTQTPANGNAAQGAPETQPAIARPPEAPQPPASAPESPPKAEAPASGSAPKQKVPTTEAFLDDMPPRAPQPFIDLPPATAGAPYRNELPKFVDPGGKGLQLAAESLPQGLTFDDLGDGKGVIEGAPTETGSATVRVVATNHAGRTAQMTATLVVADKAPAPAPPTAVEPVKAAPPAQPDHAAPPVSVSPPVHEARLETPQPTTPEERERLFVEGYNGGDCFLVKPLPGGGAPAYLGVGDKLGPFERFEEAFKREVRADPQLSLRPITTPECPILDLLRPGVGDASGPRIELTDYTVGRNKPLAGRIANLGGRGAFLILVDNDGVAYRLEAKPESGGDAATFSVPLTPDAGSARQLQVLLAIVSTKPIPALEAFRSGPLKAIEPALLEEARNGDASVGAEFFTFAK